MMVGIDGLTLLRYGCVAVTGLALILIAVVLALSPGCGWNRSKTMTHRVSGGVAVGAAVAAALGQHRSLGAGRLTTRG